MLLNPPLRQAAKRCGEIRSAPFATSARRLAPPDAPWLPNPAEGYNPKYIIEVLEKELAAQGKSGNVSAKNK